MKAQEIIETVTAEIVAEIARGTLPWTKPWEPGQKGTFGGQAMPLRVTGETYRGINVLALWVAAAGKGYQARHWMTFKQAQALGGMVRKGEKATGIIYADRVVKTEENGDGDTIEKNYAFLKAYAVFNAEQIDNLPEKFYAKPIIATTVATTSTLEIPGQEWLDAIPAIIRHGGDKACYSPFCDMIALPEPSQFKNPLAYVSTRIHELTHNAAAWIMPYGFV